MQLVLFNNCSASNYRYELQITGDGISNQQTNPEVIVDVNRPSSLLNEQMFALKTITSKLKNAYNGLDVEWIDIGKRKLVRFIKLCFNKSLPLERPRYMWEDNTKMNLKEIRCEGIE
jgi:hypothetical protein